MKILRRLLTLGESDLIRRVVSDIRFRGLAPGGFTGEASRFCVEKGLGTAEEIRVW